MVEHDPTRLYEGSRLIVESDAHGALVAFDPRVPGPRGIRVGHTGRDVERLASDYTELRCDPSGGERTLCLFESRRDHELECDNTGVGGITLYFGAAPEVVGARAREVLRHRKVVAVQVRDPVCTGD